MMTRTRTYPTEFYLCTTIVRQDNDNQPVECDAIVYFDAVMTSPYRPEQGPSYASGGQPAEGPEYDLTFSSADLDGEPSDAPGPLTAIETAQLQTWFDERKQQAAAFECANDNFDRE
jgi:hypothetical protein